LNSGARPEALGSHTSPGLGPYGIASRLHKGSTVEERHQLRAFVPFEGGRLDLEGLQPPSETCGSDEVDFEQYAFLVKGGVGGNVSEQALRRGNEADVLGCGWCQRVSSQPPIGCRSSKEKGLAQSRVQMYTRGISYNRLCGRMIPIACTNCKARVSCGADTIVD
jgi:hypothetical protein